MTVVINNVPDTPEGEAFERAWHLWIAALRFADPATNPAKLARMEREVEQRYEAAKRSVGP